MSERLNNKRGPGLPGGPWGRAHLPTRKVQVRSLDWEENLEKEMETHPSILARRIPWTEEPGGLHTVHGVTNSQTQLSN